MERRVAIAAGIDTAVVVAFVAIGRRNHDEGEAIAGIAETAAPFLIALLVAWVLLRVRGTAVWSDPWPVLTGAVVWVCTVVVGMLLRRFVFDDGTATSFIIVATIFLGTFLVGWRATAAALLARRTRPS
jgi:carbon starvation protein CstA